MKKYILVAVLFLIYSINGNAQSLLTRYSDLGRMVVTHLHNAPFPDTARAEGHTYNKQFYDAKDHYEDSTVAIFIPKGYRKTNTVDMVIHFHGWHNNVDSTFAQYNLVNQFVESGKNALLVVPEGPKNAPDSYGGKLESAGGFERFINELVDTLYNRGVINTYNVGRIILSGHSGAYRVMAFILMRGGLTAHIKEVFLFDALYAETEKYTYWINKYNGRLVDIYTEQGGTKENSEKLIADLKGWGVPCASFTDELKVSPYDLANNRLVFIYTDLVHNQVVSARNEFMKFIKASCLDDIGW